MSDLFDTAPQKNSTAPRPLADRLRPKALSDVIGQEQVLGPDAPLGVMLASKSLSSLILWGPPGVGKTTIARLLADATDLHFVQISAIFTGMPELRKVFEAAKMRRANGTGIRRHGCQNMLRELRPLCQKHRVGSCRLNQGYGSQCRPGCANLLEPCPARKIISSRQGWSGRRHQSGP